MHELYRSSRYAMSLLSDLNDTFFKNFRMSREDLAILLEMIRPKIVKQNMFFRVSRGYLTVIKCGDLIIRQNTYLLIRGHRSHVLTLTGNFTLMEISGMPANANVSKYSSNVSSCSKSFQQWLWATSNDWNAKNAIEWQRLLGVFPALDECSLLSIFSAYCYIQQYL